MNEVPGNRKGGIRESVGYLKSVPGRDGLTGPCRAHRSVREGRGSFLLAAQVIQREVTAAALELVGGTLLLLGLFTRPVAFLLSGQMAVAYFMAHAAQGNVLMPMANSGELAVLFCFVFLYLSAAGGGNLSLDHLRGK